MATVWDKGDWDAVTNIVVQTFLLAAQRVYLAGRDDAQNGTYIMPRGMLFCDLVGFKADCRRIFWTIHYFVFWDRSRQGVQRQDIRHGT